MENSTATRLELKYCEGCGALCLRPTGRSDIYCAGCEQKLPNLRPLNPDDRRTA